MSKKISFWNIPNLLTLLRIAAVPVIAWFLWNIRDSKEPNEAKMMTSSIIACIIFSGAMITDIIDGYLARKWDLVTPMGAYLDPLADKLMVTTALIMLIPLERVPAWVVALLLCREITITGLRGIASQQGMTISASALGKIKTAYQSVAIGMLLWFFPVNFPLIGETNVYACGVVLLYVSVFFSLASAVEYFVLYFVNSKSSHENK